MNIAKNIPLSDCEQLSEGTVSLEWCRLVYLHHKICNSP